MKIIPLPETTAQKERREAARASIRRYENYMREGSQGAAILALLVVAGAALWIGYNLAPDFVGDAVAFALVYWGLKQLLKGAITEAIKESRDSLSK